MSAVNINKAQKVIYYPANGIKKSEPLAFTLKICYNELLMHCQDSTVNMEKRTKCLSLFI